MPDPDLLITADLLVIGGGMAGMTAAGRAAQLGARVIVVEVADRIGGSAALSEGYVWTAPSMEVLVAEDPGVDIEQAEALLAGVGPALEWARSLGVERQASITAMLGFGVGSQIDVQAYLARMQSMVEGNGGFVFVSTHAGPLVVEDGRVVGAAILTGPGESGVIRAPWTLLATGGFQANDEMVVEHMPSAAGRLLLRSNIHSRGDGILLGVGAGADLAGEMSAFYGHLMPHPLNRKLQPSDYTGLAQYHSDRGLLVGRDGHRFCDESLGDHVNTMAVRRLPAGVAYLIADEVIRRRHVLHPFIPGMDSGLDKFEQAAKAGARFASASDLKELARAADGWGVAGIQLAETVTRYNASVERSEVIDPPRRKHHEPLVTPPYFLLEVQPAITFTYGGLRVDARTQVLDAEGEVIPGLLGAGADAGGFFRQGYAGGLVRALVFGLRAARQACPVQ